MKNILYIDACVNRDTSRTEELAKALLAKITKSGGCTLSTVYLDKIEVKPLNSDTLNYRTRCIESHDFSDSEFDYAKKVAESDIVVISAPYWDFSFPAKLKCFLEHLCCQGITFEYSPEGIPTGLCKGSKVYYVTTSGGYIGDFDFGFAQVEATFKYYFGFEDFTRISAEGLDIVTNDVSAIMNDALAEIEAL